MGVFKMSLGSARSDMDLMLPPIDRLRSQNNNQNPDPFNFTIVKRIDAGEHSLLNVVYPNCTNFKGSKILLIKRNGQTLETMKCLDPHFLEEDGNVEVIARFRPTEEGWNLGIKMLESLEE